jgi:hypothetical protein
LVAQRVLGGSAGDAVAIADHLETDIFSLSADAVMVADAMTRAVSTSRSISDASISEDSVFTGELVFAPHGISGGVNIGPIAMYTVAAAGPLTISHGPDLSTGPVGFVLNLGDYITVTDQLNPGASLTIEFGDSVEAT